MCNSYNWPNHTFMKMNKKSTLTLQKHLPLVGWGMIHRQALKRLISKMMIESLMSNFPVKVLIVLVTPRILKSAGL